MNYRGFDFRVFDLHEGKVLYGDDIPKFGEGLVEPNCSVNVTVYYL